MPRGVFEVRVIDQASGSDTWVAVTAANREDAIAQVVALGETAAEARLVRVVNEAKRADGMEAMPPAELAPAHGSPSAVLNTEKPLEFPVDLSDDQIEAFIIAHDPEYAAHVASRSAYTKLAGPVVFGTVSVKSIPNVLVPNSTDEEIPNGLTDKEIEKWMDDHNPDPVWAAYLANRDEYKCNWTAPIKPTLLERLFRTRIYRDYMAARPDKEKYPGLYRRWKDGRDRNYISPFDHSSLIAPPTFHSGAERGIRIRE